MPGLSTFDVGECCCPSGCGCLPCELPENDLTASYTFGTFPTITAGTATLVYRGSCVWSFCIATVAGGSIKYVVTCAGGVTSYVENIYSAPDTTCAGSPVFSIPQSVRSHTCSPLNVVTDLGTPGVNSVTITP